MIALATTDLVGALALLLLPVGALVAVVTAPRYQEPPSCRRRREGLDALERCHERSNR